MNSVKPFDVRGNIENKDSNEKQAVEKRQEHDIPIRRQIFDLFIELLATSSAIGPPHIARASCEVIRFMWITTFLAGTAAGLYFFAITVQQYLQYGVLNQISYAKSYPTFFPAVSICNLNPFNNNRSVAYIDNLLNTNNLSDFISIGSTDNLQAKLGTTNTIKILDNLLDDLRWWIASDKNLTAAERRRLGFELDPDMLISCSFNGKECKASDFSYYRSYTYGNCFVFNGGTSANGSTVGLLKTSKTGSQHGLTMEILTGDPTDEVRFVYKSGVFVKVFNNTLNPLQISDSTGVFLQTGIDAFISVKTQFLTKLPAPYSKCIDDYSAPPNDYAKKLYDYMSSSGVSVYTEEYCQSICYQDQLIDKCNCADASLPTLRGAAFCNSSREQCMVDFKNVFDAANLDQQCNNACPVKCFTVYYNLETSQSVYPTTYYINLLKTKSDFTDNIDISGSTGVDYIDESLVKIVVNYEDLLYQQTTEIPVISPDALVGLLGGQLGAFIGITFLSVFEVAHFFMDIIRAVYIHHKTKKANVNLK